MITDLAPVRPGFERLATPIEIQAESLTPREQEVLRLILAGRTNRQIADELVISSETVKTHVRHVLGKMGARRKADLRR